VAERASLENWRPRKGSASSNLAPSAKFSRIDSGFVPEILEFVAKLWLNFKFPCNDCSKTANFLSPSDRSASHTMA
jgi:hypothetical protein